MDAIQSDVLIIGAGVSGLSCARALMARGATVQVLDRAKSPGGRCASRTLEEGGPIFDFGPVFLHGEDPQFLDIIQNLPQSRPQTWPKVLKGHGTPCQPNAFEGPQKRYRLQWGVKDLPLNLAEGVHLKLNTKIVNLRWEKDHFLAVDEAGGIYKGRNLVLALALEQAQSLLGGLTPPLHQGKGAWGLLKEFSSLPSLTLLASYSDSDPDQNWDIWYPEDSKAILLMARQGAEGLNLVLQAKASWSAERLKKAPHDWSEELLQEAALLLGDWVLTPRLSKTHTWKHGRLNPSQHLKGPLSLKIPGTRCSLNLVGDLFDPAGGVEGAWRSGTKMGETLEWK